MQPMYWSCLEGVDWRGSVYRDGARKTKTHSKLNLARGTKDNTKGYYRSSSFKRNIVEYVGSWVSRAGYLGAGRRMRHSVSLPSLINKRLAFSNPRSMTPGRTSASRKTYPYCGGLSLAVHIQTVHMHTHPWALMGPHEHKKNLFTTRIVKHQIKLHREALESTFLEILKTQLGTALISLLYLTLV